jgi:preprotein translocase subunit SecD
MRERALRGCALPAAVACCLLLAAGAAVAADSPTPADAGADALRVTLTIEGTTVENLSGAANRTAIASALGVSPPNVTVRDRAGGPTVEVFERLSETRLREGLSAAGLDTADARIRAGVTNETLAATRDVLQARLDAAGDLGGRVTRRADGGSTLVATVRDAGRETAVDLLTRRGRVALVAGYPADGTERTRTLVTSGDLANVGQAQAGRAGRPPFVPVTLTEPAAREFAAAMRSLGFTDEGVQACRFQETPADPGWCLYTVVDGERVYAAGMSAGLADLFEDGGFVADPTFVMQTVNRSTAERLRLDLRAGALPAPVTVESLNRVRAGESGASAGGETATAAGDTATTADPGSGPGTADGRTTGGESPGFGVVATLAALAVAVVRLRSPAG